MQSQELNLSSESEVEDNFNTTEDESMDYTREVQQDDVSTEVDHHSNSSASSLKVKDVSRVVSENLIEQNRTDSFIETSRDNDEDPPERITSDACSQSVIENHCEAEEKIDSNHIIVSTPQHEKSFEDYNEIINGVLVSSTREIDSEHVNDYERRFEGGNLQGSRASDIVSQEEKAHECTQTLADDTNLHPIDPHIIGCIENDEDGSGDDSTENDKNKTREECSVIPPPRIVKQHVSQTIVFFILLMHNIDSIEYSISKTVLLVYYSYLKIVQHFLFQLKVRKRDPSDGSIESSLADCSSDYGETRLQSSPDSFIEEEDKTPREVFVSSRSTDAINQYVCASPVDDCMNTSFRPDSKAETTDSGQRSASTSPLSSFSDRSPFETLERDRTRNKILTELHSTIPLGTYEGIQNSKRHLSDYNETFSDNMNLDLGHLNDNSFESDLDVPISKVGGVAQTDNFMAQEDIPGFSTCNYIEPRKYEGSILSDTDSDYISSEVNKYDGVLQERTSRHSPSNSSSPTVSRPQSADGALNSRNSSKQRWAKAQNAVVFSISTYNSRAEETSYGRRVIKTDSDVKNSELSNLESSYNINLTATGSVVNDKAPERTGRFSSNRFRTQSDDNKILEDPDDHTSGLKASSRHSIASPLPPISSSSHEDYDSCSSLESGPVRSDRSSGPGQVAVSRGMSFNDRKAVFTRRIANAPTVTGFRPEIAKKPTKKFQVCEKLDTTYHIRTSIY